MQLNLGHAWTEATSMLNSNRDTIAVLAGLFFFLPYFALAIFAPDAVNPAPVEAPPGTDPEVALRASMEAIQAQYADNWLAFLVLFVIQFVGSLAVLALLSDRGNPTVGEALQAGVRGMPSYLATLVLSAVLAGVVVGVPFALIGFIAPPAVMIIIGIALMVGMLYLFVKFLLIAPVIAIEGELNPVKVLQRSWALTKGNSFRLVAFLILLFIAVGVVSTLVAAVFGFVFAAFSPSIENIGNGLITSLINAVVGSLFLAVYAAIHRQLAGPSTESVAGTFD